MKILLIDDVSGVHQNLRDGLHELGHECHLLLIKEEDSRNIDNVINIHRPLGRGIIPSVARTLNKYIESRTLEHYDAICIAHRLSLIDRPLFLRYKDLPSIRQSTSHLTYIALGCDEVGFVAGNSKLPYRPCQGCEVEDVAGKTCIKSTRPLHTKAMELLNKYIDSVVIPAVEYEHVSEKFHGMSYKIPFPINVNKIPWRPAISTPGTVRIVHTPTRVGFKGTSIISRAIETLLMEGQDIEYRQVSNLSYKDYIKNVEDADVVIDQVRSQSAGMNALIMLAMGKIVVSGNTVLAKEFFTFGDESPVFDGDPDVNNLTIALREIIKIRSKYKMIADAGRHYVQKHHGSKHVAAKYIELWSKSS